MLRAAIVGAALALVTPVAGAQELGRFRLAWVRDEGAERCPDAPSLAREVARRLGRDPFVATEGAPSIEASVHREGPRWVARLVVRDALGERTGVRQFTSEAPGCDAIAAAVTLGVALSIDPEAALRPPPPPTVTPPPPPPPPPPSGSRARAAPPWWSGPSASVRGLVGLNLVPTVTGGAALSIEGGVGSLLRLGGGAMYVAPQETDASPGTVTSFGITALRLFACLEPIRGARATGGVCLGLDAGVMHAAVLRGQAANAGETFWGAVGLEGRARVRVAGPLSVDAGAGLLVPFVRPRFFAGGSGATVYQPGGWAFVGSLGAAVHFR